MKAKIIPIKSRLYKINKVTKKRQRLSDNGFRDLSYIVRANDRSRYLSEKAQKLATNFHKMMQKHPEKKTFADQNFLSNITRVTTSWQNAYILKQLGHIFICEYHATVYFDGKIKRWGYIVSYTEDGEERINNPSKFYKMDSLFRPDTNDDECREKSRHISRKITTHSIYKEIIEDIPQGYISSIIEESTTEESVRDSQTKTNETSPDAAYAHGGSSTGEFLIQPDKSQESNPVDLVKPAKPRLVITAAMQNGTAQLPLPTARQEQDRLMAHRDRRQETISDEPKPIGATILSLIPRSVLKENPVTKEHQKGGGFQSTVETLPSNDTPEPNIETGIEPQMNDMELTADTTNETQLPPEHEQWREIKQNIVEAYEHPADKMEVKSFFNALEATEDTENKIINLNGSGFDIRWIKKHHFKAFAASFYKVLPDYSFQFKEMK